MRISGVRGPNDFAAGVEAGDGQHTQEGRQGTPEDSVQQPEPAIRANKKAEIPADGRKLPRSLASEALKISARNDQVADQPSLDHYTPIMGERSEAGNAQGVIPEPPVSRQFRSQGALKRPLEALDNHRLHHSSGACIDSTSPGSKRPRVSVHGGQVADAEERRATCKGYQVTAWLCAPVLTRESWWGS